jgi:hypothetical protein
MVATNSNPAPPTEGITIYWDFTTNMMDDRTCRAFITSIDSDGIESLPSAVTSDVALGAGTKTGVTVLYSSDRAPNYKIYLRQWDNDEPDAPPFYEMVSDWVRPSMTSTYWAKETNQWQPGTEWLEPTLKDLEYIVTFVGKDSEEGFSSAPTIINIPTNKKSKVTLSNIPVGDSNIAKRRIYRRIKNTDNPSTYKMVTEIADNTTTTYVDMKLDAELGVEYLSRPADTFAIGKCKFFIRHPRSYRFFAAGNPDDATAVYYSESNAPALWYTDNVVYPSTSDGPVQGLAVFGDAVLVFFENSIWAWTGNDPKEDAIWKKLPINVGTTAPDSVVLTPNSLTFLGRGGIYSIGMSLLNYSVVLQPGDGLVSNLAEGKVTKIIKSITDPSIASAVYDPVRDLYLLAYQDDSTKDYNTKILALNWSKQAFTRFDLKVGSNLCITEDDTILYQNASLPNSICSMLTGEKDNGELITVSVGTKQFDMAAEIIEKKFSKVFITALNDDSGYVKTTITTDNDTASDMVHFYEDSNNQEVVVELKVREKSKNCSIQFDVDEDCRVKDFSESAMWDGTDNGTMKDECSITLLKTDGAYGASGEWTSRTLSLDGKGVLGSTTLTFSTTTPDGTAISIQSRVSSDGGSTWGSWGNVTSGEQIAGIPVDSDVSGYSIQVKATLSSNSTTITPSIDTLFITYGYKVGAFSVSCITFEFKPKKAKGKRQ